MIKQSVVEKKYDSESGTPHILDNKLRFARRHTYLRIAAKSCLNIHSFFSFFFSFLFISDEPAIVFVLLVSATSVSIAREITFLRYNKLMSREESCNLCSRRDEIDVDLSNKEYLAPRRKEKRGREKEREREREKFIDFSARNSALPRCVLLLFRTN